jgi:hypothetical protein
VIAPDHFESLEVHLNASATYAEIVGNFSATAGVDVLIMPASDVRVFATSPDTYACSFSNVCFATGSVSRASVTAPVVQFGVICDCRAASVMPYYVVQWNSSPTANTEVTWTSPLVASYAVVLA